MANTNHVDKRISKQEKIIYAIFAYMIFMFIVIVAYRGERRITNRSEAVRVKPVGSYSVDEGHEYLDYSSYKPRKCKMSKTMSFEGHFSEDIPQGKLVWLQVENINVKVFINDVEVYNDTDFDDYLVWDNFVSEGISTQDKVNVDMEVKNPIPLNFLFSRVLENIMVGTKYELTKTNLTEHIIFILMGFYVFLMGLVLIPYCFQLKYLDGEKANTEGMMSCALMLMFGSLNCLSNNTYTGLLFDNQYCVTYFAYIVKMLTSVFIVRYVDKMLHRESFKKVTKLFCYINIIRVTLYIAVLMMTGDDYVARTAFVIIAIIGCIILLTVMIFVLIEAFSGEYEERRNWWAMVFLLFCLIVEVLFYILTGTYITRMLTIGLVLFTLTEWALVSRRNLQNVRLAKKAQELENELTQSQVKMMISQIQPHFLYNALGTIRALCIKDPQTARQAIDSFAKYLRANMDSLNQKGCIPFSKELEHTECYLFIEKLRFGDLLNIEYDIQTKDFEIPALSLQTMAENAVKHGLLAKREGGTLKISTSETNSYYVVRIEDDGVGFDINKPMSKERSHVGVANTRQRIAAMCGGSVSIGSKSGVGTTITILIPKGEND